jgi:hypothetical protein
VPFGLKPGSLNLLEPSGPVQACNGIALPLPLHCNYSNEGDAGFLSSKTIPEECISSSTCIGLCIHYNSVLLVAAIWKGTFFTSFGNVFVNYFYDDNLIFKVN